MKRLLSISLFLFLNFFCYSQNKNTLNNDFFIKEVKNIHKLIIHKDGRPYVQGTVLINNSFKADCFFLLDTCYPKSVFVNYSTKQSLSDYFIYSNEKNTSFLKCDCDFNSFSISNWNLEYHNNGSFDFSEISDNYIVGIIGTDILMKDSFYISLTKKEFGWSKDFKFNTDKTIQTYDVIEQKQKGLSSIYQIEVNDNFFKSSNEFTQFLSKDKKKSKYHIDTGSYFIFTSDFNDFYSIVKEKNYKNYVYRNYMDSIGISLVENVSLLNKDFENIQFNGGRFGTGILKVLGCQILAAFDLYFIKNEKNEIGYLTMIPVSNEEYLLYKQQNDKRIQYSTTTFGFITDYSQDGEVVRYKAYKNNNIELLPDLEIGDIILAVNGKKYSYNVLQELGNSITLKIKKRDKKIKTIKAVKYSLEEKE